MITGKLVFNALLLVYSAAVVPIQLSFWEKQDICHVYPTLFCDLLVDTVFLVCKNCDDFCFCSFIIELPHLGQLDIFANFFIGFYLDGIYCDRLDKVADVLLKTFRLSMLLTITSRQIAWHYVSSPTLFW